jgi:hypothetical protein
LEGKGNDESSVPATTEATAAFETQLKAHIGRLVDYKDGVLTLGAPEGKKLVSVEQGIIKLEGKGSIETVQISSVKKIVETV